MCRLPITILACLAMALPAAAQETGGLSLGRSLPFSPMTITARDVQQAHAATLRGQRHQGMITRVRGDAGYLAGFSFGVPLAASVQPRGGDGGVAFGRPRPRIVVNRFEGPVAITEGSGNVIQLQQGISGSGPVALQQVTNGQPTPGSIVNVVDPSGNVVQRTGRARSAGQ
ncbi:conserved exported protein of unknown function [Rhodovastum atsumiense]|uniref:Uncharacterized protein n=1 Tax=Rhodovastum atsumiense TaxID=504468 RepID=A0A5M6INM8_9PROT|nr:hypothetical protein [Rhodovastum atsumiense]KAA5609873.1 hypothetical protein F1189_22040 [Rhodovastum atsumiense]CAH2602426.1 conserved exported protein of unknown function [Rhodovastum atsumiense]